MKKILLAALAAPSLVAALSFSPAAFADNTTVNPAPAAKYNGDPDSQAAHQADQNRYYRSPYAYGYGTRDRDLRNWERRHLEAAPRGYRWQRHGDRYALVRRSDGAIVQWHR